MFLHTSSGQQQDLQKLRKVAGHAGVLKRPALKRPAASSKEQVADPSTNYQPPMLVSTMPVVNALNLWGQSWCQHVCNSILRAVTAALRNLEPEYPQPGCVEDLGILGCKPIY